MNSLKRLFRPLTLISYADLATLTSAILGFLAITYIIDGTVKSYIVALFLLPISAIIDGMDGALARKFGTKHDYGKYFEGLPSPGLTMFIVAISIKYSLINDFDNVLVPLSIGLVSLLTVTTIPYAKARAGFLLPILFGILVLFTTVILRYFENDIWETTWYAAFALYMSYFALIPFLIVQGYFDD